MKGVKGVGCVGVSVVMKVNNFFVNYIHFSLMTVHIEEIISDENYAETCKLRNLIGNALVPALRV